MTVRKIAETKAGSIYTYYGQVTIVAGDTYSTGGITMNLSGAKASRPPLMVLFDSNAGYIYDYNPGTNATNGKLQIRQGTDTAAPLAEIGAGAPPAGVQSDTIKFKADFIAML